MSDDYELKTPTPDYTRLEWAELSDAEKRAAWAAYRKREQRVLGNDPPEDTPEPLPWRRLAIALLALLGGSLALTIHTQGLYSAWGDLGVIDKVAHFGAGLGIAGLTVVVLDWFDLRRQTATALVILHNTAWAVLWEVWEASPYGYDYAARFPVDPAYVPDTVADVALGILAAFVVVYLATHYSGRL